MKQIQLLEILQSYKPATLDIEGNITDPGIEEVSEVYEENGFRYEEDLCLSKLEKETTEKVIRKKDGTKVPTHWETKDEEWKENRYFGLRENAYRSECERLTSKYPNRIFLVRISEV